ncbi:hypothetical protein DdX_16391 [Ditylenchus destructor]|uniref:F-box domain-containing protein n=1 Tax=Ditylenchus destructor TaxID=166010 RepID=A0AAD4QXE0_9BILA|nr:hypothetical protein DdX_19279 [Ditylenchus destructor]KAI1700953.1 hypothetical protein DdX_16391 [Ditylenchus destructor]
MCPFPTEVLSVITNFLPIDDITDLMLLSKQFSALAAPRLRPIDEEMATMNQSIKSFLPVGNEWISQLDFKRFLPIGSQAKNRMKSVFENRYLRVCLGNIENSDLRATMLPRIKERMSLERFDDPTFLRILGALIARPEFRQEYNVCTNLTVCVKICYQVIADHFIYPNDSFLDVMRILGFYSFYM